MVTGVLDYLFKVGSSGYASSTAQLASFLGLFYTATNLAAIALQWFGTGWMMRTIGASWASSLLPAGLALGAGLIFAFPGFAAVTASRFWDQVVRTSLSRSTGELFYFPLEPGLRRKAKALIGAGLERLGDGFAGLVILAASAAMGASMTVLVGVVVVLIAVWALAWMRVKGGYVTELARNLRRLNLEGHKAKISLREASLVQEMERLRASPYERIVIHGIELLEEAAPEMVEASIGRLLEHPSAAVRSRALRFLRAHPPAELPPRLGFGQDADPRCRSRRSARWACCRAPIRSIRCAYLESPEERIRKGCDSGGHRERAARIGKPPARHTRAHAGARRRVRPRHGGRSAGAASRAVRAARAAHAAADRSGWCGADRGHSQRGARSAPNARAHPDRRAGDPAQRERRPVRARHARRPRGGTGRLSVRRHGDAGPPVIPRPGRNPRRARWTRCSARERRTSAWPIACSRRRTASRRCRGGVPACW
jgi:hypothetical protein